MSQPAFYASLRNNTSSTWYKDAGLRRMAIHIFMLYHCIFANGYDGSLLNGLQTVPRWQKDFDNPAGSDLGLMSASLWFAKTCTPFAASYIGDRWGRRVALFVGSAIGIAGALVNTFANGRGMYVGGRVLLGGGLGMMATIAPPMLQELAHPRLRSVFAATWLVFFFVGSTIAAWLCYGMIEWDNSWAWRLPTLIQGYGPFGLGLYIACGYMTESPRWLVGVGKEDQALRILARLHANGDENDELVQYEMAEIRHSLELDRQLSTNYDAFFRTRGNRKRLLVISVIAASGQLCGNGLISYYIAPILKLVGITKPVQVAGINGGLAIWNGFTTLGLAQLVERIGRRPMWITGISGVFVSFACVTGLSGAFAQSKVGSVGIGVIPFLYLFNGFYNMSWSCLGNLYVTEITPFSLRVKGLSLFVFVQSCALAFNQYVNPIALNAIAWKYYIVYLVVQVGLIIFAYFVIIETKGHTIEEVARLFDGKEASDEITTVAAAGKIGDGEEDKERDLHLEQRAELK